MGHQSETSPEIAAEEQPVMQQAHQSRLAKQFGHPTGLLGHLVGYFLSARGGEMSRAAVEMCNVRGDDQVLEIGFGPGRAIEALAVAAEHGKVAGVDVSEVMLAQARRRNRRAIAAGRVDLRLGCVTELPFSDQTFDKVLAINSLHHWPSPRRGLQEIRRVLNEGGTLLLALRMQTSQGGMLKSPGVSETELLKVMETLVAAKFKQVRVERREDPLSMACVLAQR